MATIDDITKWTNVMKVYYASSILNDIAVLNGTFNGGYTIYPRERLMTLEIAELKVLSFDVSKRLRTAAFARLFELRGKLFAEQRAEKLAAEQLRKLSRETR